MRIECKHCLSCLEIDENIYEPGEIVSVECRRCGGTTEIIIPGRPNKKEENIAEQEKTEISEKSSQSNPEPESPLFIIESTPEDEVQVPQAMDDVTCFHDSRTAHIQHQIVDEIESILVPNPETREKDEPPIVPPKRKSTKRKKEFGEINVSAPTLPPDPPKSGKNPEEGGCLKTLGSIVVLIGMVVWMIWDLRSCGNDNKAEEIDSPVSEITYAQEVAVESVYTMPQPETVYIVQEIKDSMEGADTEIHFEEGHTFMGCHVGINNFNAEMINSDGRRFPFELSFEYNPDDYPGISKVIYYNPSAPVRARLYVEEIGDDFIRFAGEVGKKELIIQFSGSDPYTGDSWWGDLHQEIEMRHKYN